ncbi:MAG: SRPBCC domain-containing protein [Patescibacteria group bacterium]
MPNLFLEKSIEIAKPAIDVWQAFVNPSLSRKTGGEYVSDWSAGSPITWKDADGTARMNGKILKLEAGKLLKHNVFRDVDGASTLSSVITYELRGRQDGKTTLLARESFAEPAEDKPFSESAAAWDARLEKLKDAVESAVS